MDNKLLFYFDKPMFFDFNIILKKGVIEEDGFARCLCFDFNFGLQEIIRCEDKMEVFEDGR